MPMIDLNAAENWDGGANSLYTSYVTGTWTGLTRDAFLQAYYRDSDLLLDAMVSVGLQVGHRIAFVGAQFGWMAERFVERGYGPLANGTTTGKVCAVDTSSWIQASRAGNAMVNIVNADVNSATGRRAVRQQFGSANAVIDWAVTCTILPVLTDGEVAPFCSSVRNVANNVVHWLTPLLQGPPAQDPRLNWKTLATWKALVTPDYVVHEGTAVIL